MIQYARYVPVAANEDYACKCLNCTEMCEYATIFDEIEYLNGYL